MKHLFGIHRSQPRPSGIREIVILKGDDNAHSCALVAGEYSINDNIPIATYLSREEATNLGQALIDWAKRGPTL